MEDALMWYGYRHIDGTIHAKRYFRPDDIQECRESNFVEDIYGPFECDSRTKAMEQIEIALGGE